MFRDLQLFRQVFQVKILVQTGFLILLQASKRSESALKESSPVSLSTDFPRLAEGSLYI